MKPPAGRRRSTVLTVARFEGRKRLRTTAVAAAVLSAYGVLFVWVGPDLVGGEELQVLLDAMPPVMVELLGFESLASLSGLLAGEYYTFGWLVGLAGYVAYTAAGSVAGDVESGRMDTMLAAPISRGGVLLGSFLALLVPIVGINAVTAPVLYLAAAAVGDPLPAADLLALPRCRCRTSSAGGRWGSSWASSSAGVGPPGGSRWRSCSPPGSPSRCWT
ncbi:ABC transporter permease [Halolamina rubra]|uniref:ABC transporter permease n=1 Tax=Halolamina rubra TaxID=1380430 RepID=UPI001929D21D|nr:ABC transporter permease subunit [Halolamina rubra]